MNRENGYIEGGGVGLMYIFISAGICILHIIATQQTQTVESMLV